MKYIIALILLCGAAQAQTYNPGTGGGSGTPGGSTTQVQYNNAGSFGGTSFITVGTAAATVNGVTLGTTGLANTYLSANGTYTNPNGSAAPTLRNVATHAGIAVSMNASYNSFNTRTVHIAGDTLTAPQIVLQNWYATSSGEQGSGGTATYSGWIEYSMGTCTAFTFSSSSTGTAANGANIITDPVALSAPIPKGGEIWNSCA